MTNNSDERNPPNEYHQARIADALERIADRLEELTDWRYNEASIRTVSRRD